MFSYQLDITNFKDNDQEKININYIRSLLDIKRLGDLLQIKVAQNNNYLFITGDQMAFIISTLGYDTQALWGGPMNKEGSGKILTFMQGGKGRRGGRTVAEAPAAERQKAEEEEAGGKEVRKTLSKNTTSKQQQPQQIIIEKDLDSLNETLTGLMNNIPNKGIYDIYNETLTKLINNIPEDKGEVGDNTVIAFEFMFVADIFLSNYEHLTEKEKIAIDELIKELTNKTNNILTSEDKLPSSRNKTPTSVKFTPVNDNMNKTNNIPTSEDKLLPSARNKTNNIPTSEYKLPSGTKRTQSNRNNPNTMKTTRTAPVTVIPSAAAAAGGGEEYE